MRSLVGLDDGCRTTDCIRATQTGASGCDCAGNVVWRLDRNEEIPTNDSKTTPSLRQHHDWQREDFPSGYYSPDATPARSGSNTLVLTHTDRRVPAIAGEVLLADDRLIDVSPKAPAGACSR